MEKLTSKHFVFLLVGATSATLLNYPSLFIGFGGRDTWIFTIISCIIFLIFYFYIFKIMDKTKSYDFNEVCHAVLGKFLGNIFLLIFSITLVLICIESASLSSSAIHTNVFIDTPVWYSLIFFILAVFFISKNRFNSLLMITIMSVTIIIVLELLMGLLNLHYTDFSTLLPILHDRNTNDYILCTITQLGALSSFFILLPIIRRMDDRTNLNKYSFITMILLAVFLVWYTIDLIATLGPYRSINIFFPQFIQAQMIYFGGFIENGELFIIITSLLSWIIKYVLAIFSLYAIWQHKIKSKKIFIGIISMIVFIVSYLTSKNIYKMFSNLVYYQYILLIVLFICPIVIYTIYGFKKGFKR